MKNTGRTALVPGWYVEFQAALLRQAPRPGEIDQVTAEGWINNQKSLKKKLAGCLVPPPKNENKIIETNPYLKRLSGDTPIIIPACDGSSTLAEAKEVFKSHIDPDFKKWGLDKPGEPTKETAVVVHEIVRNGIFEKIFGSFGVDLDKLCFTQHQIEVFCEKHPDWLRIDGYGTFFLTKKNWKNSATIGNLFVASVLVYFDGLNVNARQFEDDDMWYADGQRRLVVPQLET